MPLASRISTSCAVLIIASTVALTGCSEHRASSAAGHGTTAQQADGGGLPSPSTTPAAAAEGPAGPGASQTPTQAPVGAATGHGAAMLLIDAGCGPQLPRGANQTVQTYLSAQWQAAADRATLAQSIPGPPTSDQLAQAVGIDTTLIAALDSLDLAGAADHARQQLEQAINDYDAALTQAEGSTDPDPRSWRPQADAALARRGPAAAELSLAVGLTPSRCLEHYVQ